MTLSGGGILWTTQSPGCNKRITEIQGRLSGRGHFAKRTTAESLPLGSILSPKSAAAAPSRIQWAECEFLRRSFDVRPLSHNGPKSDRVLGPKSVSKRDTARHTFELAVAAHSKLGHSHDYVCLNFGSNFAASVSVRDLRRGVVSCCLQLSCISCFDLVA